MLRPADRAKMLARPTLILAGLAAGIVLPSHFSSYPGRATFADKPSLQFAERENRGGGLPKTFSPDTNSVSSSDLAHSLLADRITANRTNFYVYQDADSGFNHGFASGFFGDTSRIRLETACLDDPGLANGCSTDLNRLDQTGRNALRVSFDPLPTGSFAGINIEEPENYGANPRGVGYDLRGATHVVFDARSPTPGGINAQFGVGGSVSQFFHVPQSSTYTTISIALNTLTPSPPNLADLHFLFTVVTNDANAPNGGILLLDNIRFTPVPLSQQSALGFPISTETFGVVPRLTADPGRVPIPADQLLRNLTTNYESSLALLALLERGTSQDLGNSRLIADTFLYAIDHDNHGDPLPVAPDGSVGLHDGYESGDIGLLNNQGAGAGQSGDVRLSGFSAGSALCGPSRFCLILDGATGGNNSFTILSLAAAYKRFSDARYLDGAREIGRWIFGNLRDTTGTGFGGYYLGYPDSLPPPKPLLRGKSVENNADIFAAFTILSDIERSLGNNQAADEWTMRANIAGDFVMQMFDSASGRFFAGTVPAGTSPGPGINPVGSQMGNDVINTFDFLDSNTFTTLALASTPRYRTQIDWRRPVQYVLDHFAQTITVSGHPFQGFNIVQSPTAGPNGIAWEFTGQAVVVMRLVDCLYDQSTFEASALFYLDQIRRAQSSAPFGDGRGLVASTLQNGNTLAPIEQCLSTPFQCIPERVGLAATAWAIFAERNINVMSVARNLGCSFSIPFSSQSFGAQGGSQSIAVSSLNSCSWTAVSNADWITIISGKCGSGNGTVSYSVAPNTGTAARTAALVVAGHVFTVTQVSQFTVDSIGLFRPSGPIFFLRNSNTTGPPDLSVPFGAQGDIPIVGDWDGNGTTTIGLYRPSTNTFFLRNSNSTGFPDLSVPFGAAGDVPIAGDWDGNGTTTIGLYRPSTNTFFLRNSNTTGFPDLSIPFGASGDIPIVGDWDGNGTTTIGLFRPSGPIFFLRNSNTTGFPDLSIPYGATGDLAVVGDWDGDGTTTIGLYRPSGNIFFLRNSNTTGFPDLSVPFGASGDQPLAGDWDGQ